MELAVVDERDLGCLCHECGRRYKVDFRLTNELWNQINNPPFAKRNLLCGSCIAKRIEALGRFDYYDLIGM